MWNGHLPSRVVPGVGRMGLREVSQIARRERRGDGRERERQETAREDAGENRAMRHADHDARLGNKNPAIVVASSAERRSEESAKKIADNAMFPCGMSNRRFCSIDRFISTFAKEQQIAWRRIGRTDRARSLRLDTSCVPILVKATST